MERRLKIEIVISLCGTPKQIVIEDYWTGQWKFHNNVIIKHFFFRSSFAPTFYVMQWSWCSRSWKEFEIGDSLHSNKEMERDHLMKFLREKFFNSFCLTLLRMDLWSPPSQKNMQFHTSMKSSFLYQPKWIKKKFFFREFANIRMRM